MTSLTGIYLRNFQSIKGPVFLQLDKLCFLYGPNSAGKSTILDALDLIQKIVNESFESESRLEDLFEVNEGSFGKIGFGIEFICQKPDSLHQAHGSSEFDKWWNAPDQRGDYFHRELFLALVGKKIQIEFGGELTGEIKVAIDGEPLFEISGDFIYHNIFFEKVNTEEEALSGDSDLMFPSDMNLQGHLIIHKGNKLNHIFKVCYDHFDPSGLNNINQHFRKLFFEEHNDVLKIHGINFSASREWQTNLVDVGIGADEIIFGKYKKLVLVKPDDEYQKFIQEQFDEDTNLGKEATSRRQHIYWKLKSLSRDLDKLLQGFFLHINDAIDYSHVRGDRQILDSRNCVSYPRHLDISLKNCVLTDHDTIAQYSRFLADTGPYTYFSNIKDDFINKSLKDYLVSLRGYEIYTSCYDLTSKDICVKSHASAEKFIYLLIRNKEREGLGFQDVGSGISYVFPVLTSLWHSALSFIEQPELHLHPSAQCELGDVFIAAYHKGSFAIVESHSEHMLLRVLRRIRETTNNYLLPRELKFEADNLRIYYFNPEPDGYTSIKEIRVDKHGELLNRWPGGFFSERDRELFDE